MTELKYLGYSPVPGQAETTECLCVQNNIQDFGEWHGHLNTTVENIGTKTNGTGKLCLL